MAINITDDNFKTEVLESDVPVLMDFWAEWCGPCRMIGPIIDELSKEYKDKVKICKMDIDANPNTPSSYGVRSIPTLLILKGGKVVETMVGALPKDKIVEKINSHL